MKTVFSLAAAMLFVVCSAKENIVIGKNYFSGELRLGIRALPVSANRLHGSRMETDREIHPEERYEKIKQELAVFHESSNLFGKTWKPYLTTCILTIVQIACTCSIPYFIYRSFGFLEQPINVIMAAQAYVSMVSAFVPLPGASGGAEGSFVLFFRSFFSEGTIIPAMVVWRTMSYYLNFPIGCICTYIADRLPKLSFGSEKMKECA